MIQPSSFLLEGGATGILLIHGFTGSPPEMRLAGHVLNVDSEWEQVAEETYQFILKHVPATLKNDQKREAV